MPYRAHFCWFLLIPLTLIAARAAAEPSRVEHPFLLWTKDDAANIRRQIETEPWARKAHEQLLAADKSAPGLDFRELFRYAVMNDAQAGQAQKQKLLGLLRAPDPLGASLEWRILAYDVLYNDLAASEREQLEARFRKYITYAIKPGGCYDADLFNNKVNYARYDGENGKYTRTNWLPNIIFPWKISANLAALALRDEKLIRDTWAVHGSLKWYFDEYLCDLGFYTEEFSKMYSTPGALWLYCTGARNLGLDELGLGYKGKGGATMKGHMLSVLAMTWPRVDLGSDRPMYPRFTLGDVRAYPPFQDATVRGHFPDGSGGERLFVAAGAWGGTTRGNSQQWDNDKTQKMGMPLWFELSHRFWPDAGFDYFLAQMRAPGEDVYTPTLFFGLKPIDPKKVKAPPAPSAIYPERGLVILRHDHSPAYWESPAPAAGLRLCTDYAHNVNDSLALCGYYAFNRPIYMNPKSDPGYAFGFSRSVRSHCSVMIDGHIKVDDWGKTGSIEPKFTSECATRQAFEPEVKFAAARTAKRYPGIDETRALMLTGQYMLDVFSCADTREHTFTWIVHTFGRADTPKDWESSGRLKDLIPQLFDERSKQTGEPWSITVRQARRDAEPADSPLGEKWFARKIGVTVRMLGENATTAFVTRTPRPGNVQTDPAGLVNGITLLAQRTAKATAFVALHEPFEGAGRIATFERIAQTPAAVGVRVTGAPGSGIDDRLLLRIGDQHDQPATLEGGGESFTFADYAFVRRADDSVIVRGDLRALTLRCPAAKVKLLVNGEEVPAEVREGVLRWSR